MRSEYRRVDEAGENGRPNVEAAVSQGNWKRTRRRLRLSRSRCQWKFRGNLEGQTEFG
jgi:hypothetical protein